MAVKIQRLDIDAEVCQCGDGEVVVVGNTGQGALLDMFAGNKNWDGVGLAAEHAVALAIAAMVAGDAEEPVFIGECGAGCDDIQYFTNHGVALGDGVAIFLRVWVEASGMAAMVRQIDEIQNRVWCFGRGEQFGEIFAVGGVAAMMEFDGGMFGSVFVFAP